MSGEYNTLDDLRDWAAGVMTRDPDFVIGDNYLRRWWVIPRNKMFNVYLHDIRKSDDDRAFHDHPWANSSLVLSGRYIEHTPEGSFERKAGDIVNRAADALHRLEIMPDERAISLFQTGPITREWGFACPQGWVHWRDFTNPDDTGQVGRGCGEMTEFPAPRVAPALDGGEVGPPLTFPPTIPSWPFKHLADPRTAGKRERGE